MSDRTLLKIMDEMGASQQAISTATPNQANDRRHEVVLRPRKQSEQIGRIGVLIGATASSTQLQTVFRSTLSDLRSALAGHRASWPAVSIDPLAPLYCKSVQRVRSAYAALDQALRAAQSKELTQSEPPLAQIPSFGRRNE